VELFSSFDNGSDITALTGVINRGGAGDEFKVSPDGTLVAYLIEENNAVFELFAITPDGEEAVRLSGSFAEAGDVLFFEWVP